MPRFYITGPDVGSAESPVVIPDAIDRVDAFFKAGLRVTPDVNRITVWTEQEWNDPMAVSVRKRMVAEQQQMRADLLKEE